MEYRGRGRFPGQVPRFQYPRPGGPALLRPRPPTVRQPRGLLAAPTRTSFEASRAPRPQQFTPRGTFHTPFRGFKATPMIPRSEIETPHTDVKGVSDRQNANSGQIKSKETSSEKQINKPFSTLSSDKKIMNKPDSNSSSQKPLIKNPDSNSGSDKPLINKPSSNPSSFYEDISNQDSKMNESSNQDSYSEQTTNQNDFNFQNESANQNPYFDESANQEPFSDVEESHQQSTQEAFQSQEQVGKDENYGENDTGGWGGQGMEEDGGEEEEEEDTGFCHYCKMPFGSDEAYWKHTRGLLHTQKVMEAEKDMNTSQTMDKQKDETLTVSPASTTKMENTASERDMEYLLQVGFSPQRGTGRGFNRGEHQSPAKRGHFDQGHGRGQSQGQNFRGSFGQGRGQGHNRYGINFSDANATELGQRGRQEQEVEGYSGYNERGGGYQDYGHQEENYGQGGAYDDNNMEGGERQDDYNFYTSNWMEPPEKIPASERDIDPDTIGKPQFPSDFYCKVCDVSCTSQKNFEMHVEGTKHRMKFFLGKGDPGAEFKEDKKKMVVCSQPSKVEHIIRKSDLPIIGLQYFTEFQKSDPSIRPTYVCNLCESKCDMNTVLSHATGFKHRMNYFKENHPDIYSHMNSNTAKKKSEQNASAEEFALDCMKRDGQGKIKVKLEIDHATETFAANLLSKSGITVDTFLEDLKNKPGPPGQEKKKQRITPDILAKQESYGGSRDRGHNKRASESHYDFPSKQPRGHRDNYGNMEDYNNQSVFDYNHKGNQRGYSGGENQFMSYNQPSSYGPKQMGRHGDQRGPHRVPPNPGNNTDDEDKELFKEFLEWKRQKKVGKNNQSNVQAETSQNAPPTQTEKKALVEVTNPETSSNSAADMMFALSQTMIKTEEDAAMALQVSNALTQALLQYRLKNVPKELTAALSTAAGQTSSVQTRSKESKPSSSKGARKPPNTQSVQNTAPTSAPAPAPVPYPQGISSTSPQLSRPLTHTTTESSLDSRLQYMNPVNPSFPNNPNPVPAPPYPGSVPNTQYPGYTFYEGQYQPQAPEGYQWGYSAVNQGEAPPPLPPSEDLPKPPPENQTY